MQPELLAASAAAFLPLFAALLIVQDLIGQTDHDQDDFLPCTVETTEIFTLPD